MTSFIDASTGLCLRTNEPDQFLNSLRFSNSTNSVCVTEGLWSTPNEDALLDFKTIVVLQKEHEGPSGETRKLWQSFSADQNQKVDALTEATEVILTYFAKQLQ